MPWMRLEWDSQTYLFLTSDRINKKIAGCPARCPAILIDLLYVGFGHSCRVKTHPN